MHRKKIYIDEILIYDTAHHQSSLTCEFCKAEIIDQKHDLEKCIYRSKDLDLFFFRIVNKLYKEKKISQKSYKRWTYAFMKQN